MNRFAVLTVVALTACTKPAGPPQSNWPPPADVSEALPVVAEIATTAVDAPAAVSPADAPSPVTP